MTVGVRVAIVDDHRLVASGVAALLGAEPDLEIVGVAHDTAGAIELIDRVRPDVVICDVQLGDESGFSLMARCAGGASAFVMYSSHDHPTYHRAAFDGGAAAFVLKSGDSAELLGAVRAAACGRSSFTSSTIRAVRAHQALPTRRELEVITLLADGRTTDEVAEGLGIRPRTVDSHLRSMFARLGVVSRTELVARAVGEGWVRPKAGGPADGRAAGPTRAGWVADDVIPRDRPQPGFSVPRPRTTRP